MNKIEHYLDKYCAEIGIPPSDIIVRREQSVSIARQVFCLVAKSRFTMKEIAALVNKHRTTVIMGIRHAQDLIDTRDEYTLICFEKCAKIMEV